MSKLNINKPCVLLLSFIMSVLFLSCSDAKKTTTTTYIYKNTTDKIVTIIFNADFMEGKTIEPKNEVNITREHLIRFSFWESVREITLEFEDGKAVTYTRDDVPESETNLCNQSNYKNLILEITNAHYNEARNIDE